MPSSAPHLRVSAPGSESDVSIAYGERVYGMREAARRAKGQPWLKCGGMFSSACSRLPYLVSQSTNAAGNRAVLGLLAEAYLGPIRPLPSIHR